MTEAAAAFGGFALVMLRVTALCMVMPILGAMVVPARVRLAVAAAISIAVTVALPVPVLPTTSGALFRLALAETAIGVVGGLVPRLLLAAVGAAGSMAGMSAGFGFFATEVDPGSGAASSGLERFFAAAGLVFALSIGLHREAVAWLVWSFQAAPAGGGADLMGLCRTVITQSVASCVLMVRLGFPVLGAVTAGHLLLGLLGRAATQLNLSSMGLTTAVMTGGVAIYQCVIPAARLAAEAARQGLWG